MKTSVSSLRSPGLGPTFWSIITIRPKAVVVVSIVDLGMARPLAHLLRDPSGLAGLCKWNCSEVERGECRLGCGWSRASFKIKVENMPGVDKSLCGHTVHAGT